VVYIRSPLRESTILQTLTSAELQPRTELETLATALEQQGYVVLPEGLPVDVAGTLMAYLEQVDDGAFHSATVGRGDDQQRNRFVRRDAIHWLDEHHPALAPWREWTESLRVHLNQRLFLGLFSFESQLAHYRPGDFYRTHLDAFRGEANRVVSLVTYLNPDWQDGDGGELVLHTDFGAVHVPPAYRTVALFLSEEMPHEVLPARRDRFSVAGWFRLNSTVPGRVDPPR